MLFSWLFWEALALTAGFCGFGFMALTGHNLAKLSFYFGGPVSDLMRLLFKR